MKLLIDTSTERGIVALADHQGLHFYEELPFGLQNSNHLFPAILKGISSLAKGMDDLSCIIAGVGPGSYTGIRVGAAVAQALAFPRKLPLVGVSSLAGFVPYQEGEFAAIVDAKTGGAYLLQGVRSKEKITYTSEPILCQVKDLGVLLTKRQTLVTPYAASLQERMRELELDQGWVWEERYPDPQQLFVVAEEKFTRGDIVYGEALELIYLQEWQKR